MNTDSWLASATTKLDSVGIGTARLDALVLLEDVTRRDRAYLLAHPELELSVKEIAKLANLLNLRLTHIPLAYVRAKTEFYGRNYVITPAVLEPRPESETMIEQLVKLSQAPNPRLDWSATVHLADVGSGSGALGITAKLELPNINVDLLDIDEKALEVSKINVDLFTLRIDTILSDILTNTSQNYDILLCNLPYVPDDYQINSAAMHEPKIAIFGGPDGLDLYRKLFDQVKNSLNKPLYILTECLQPQHDTLHNIAMACGYNLLTSEDFIQVFEKQ